ncbi:hypothetical protein HK100_012113 [Physocladia obscura]|uniref:Ketoreductase domain-containing protein n=1 Tax=Physocladia obscura TaxID=109957 RepID=A0AAD5XDJ7_9FUNG|nr:hypothetical protein HK100_012113 [Physocladia obscura]
MILETSTFLATILVLITSVLFLFKLANPAVFVDWSEEIVVVTGGSQGVGLAIVKRLLTKYKPKHVIILSIAPLTENFDSEKVTYFPCDVSDYIAVKKIGDRINEKIGVPTMLINNAGILGGKKFLDLEPSVIERVINVNLLGTMWTTKVFLPQMIESNHGHILNVSSLLGIGGIAGVAEYCASKFGVSGFTESMIQETKHTNVKFSGIYPGLISTDLFRGVKYRFDLFPTLSPEEVAEEILNILTNGRSAEVVIPWTANIGRAMKLVPVGVQNIIKDAAGANNSMNTYIPPDNKS